MKTIRRLAGAAACFLLSLSFQPASAPAQDGEGLEPGEAYSTRFSGTTTSQNEDGDDITVIDTDGIVGSAIDLREPGQPPKGEHWVAEPQRLPLTAAQVGQVFGIAMDDAEPPNVFVAATAAFGLHRATDGSGWMPGMWGPEGGPGTIYKLNAENGYAPEVFATITLDGRENSGPALGNIAYDKTHKQLYVSDLETGMIHRVNAETGELLGHFDHGIDGRSTFIDAATGEYETLPVIEFDPASEANLNGCETDFSTTPGCWNVADYRRRVWGLGIFEDPDTGQTRLFYAVWSNDPLGAEDWEEGGDDQRNSIWSIAITEDGDFDIDEVRREFLVPPFGGEGTLSAQAAVSDLAFSKDGTMLIAERGGMRNLGLGEIQAFARPYTSRVIQYKRRKGGRWTPIARFDVGFYDRVNDGEPYLRAGASGGVDYGFGYTADGVIDPNRPQRMVWAAGDYLCSPEGPCNDPDEGPRTDEDQVHGLQGTPRKFDSKLLPDAAVTDYPASGEAYAPRGPDNSYLIDLDLNIDGFGRVIEEEATRDDSGGGGDIEVVQGTGQALPPPPQHAKQLSAFHNKYDSNRHDKSRSLPVHTKARSHSRQGSHDREISHYRTSSHDLRRSHYRYGSHNRVDSHYRIWSHNRRSSHRKYGSHTRLKSHRRLGSHNLRKSHFKLFSHYRPKSHFKGLSQRHVRKWSHYRPQSHNKSLSGGHVRPWSHYRPNSHRRSVSGLHIKPWSHYRPKSHARSRSIRHVKPFSHFKPQSRVRPLNCTGGRIPQANRCVCPPNRPFWNGQRCRRRAQPAQCTGGRVLQGNQCVCPARRPNWDGQRCLRRAQPVQCTGGRVLRNNQCVCPARRPNWNGQRCVRRAQPVQCSGGRVLRNNQCVCPANRPRWDGNRCRRPRQQPQQCSGGRVLRRATNASVRRTGPAGTATDAAGRGNSRSNAQAVVFSAATNASVRPTGPVGTAIAAAGRGSNRSNAPAGVFSAATNASVRPTGPVGTAIAAAGRDNSRSSARAGVSGKATNASVRRTGPAGTATDAAGQGNSRSNVPVGVSGKAISASVRRTGPAGTATGAAGQGSSSRSNAPAGVSGRATNASVRRTGPAGTATDAAGQGSNSLSRSRNHKTAPAAESRTATTASVRPANRCGTVPGASFGAGSATIDKQGRRLDAGPAMLHVTVPPCDERMPPYNLTTPGAVEKA